MVQTWPKGPAPIIMAYRLEIRGDAATHLNMPPSVLVEGADIPAIAREWKLGNVRDPVKVQSKLDEKAAKFLEEAPRLPLTGHVSAVTAVDIRTGKVLSYCDPEPDDKMIPKLVAVRFLQHVLDQWGYRQSFPPWPSFADQPDVVFLGFKPRDLIRVAAVEAATKGFPVPVSLWHGNQRLYDLYEMVVGCEARAVVGMEKFGYRAGVGLIDNYPAGEHLPRDLIALRQLIFGYRLLPPPYLEAMKEIKIFQCQKPEEQEETETPEAPTEEAPKARRRRAKKGA